DGVRQRIRDDRPYADAAWPERLTVGSCAFGRCASGSCAFGRCASGSCAFGRCALGNCASCINVATIRRLRQSASIFTSNTGETFNYQGPSALSALREVGTYGPITCSVPGRARSRWPSLDWHRGRVRSVRQVLGEATAPLTRLVELPGRGVTRVWECAGPPGAETLVLIHGVAFTAELNWGKVFAPLSRYFRVIAIDLRGHGDGIRTGSRFRLEDCADDIAALAEVLGLGRFAAVGYSMGGVVAQLLYRRH